MWKVLKDLVTGIDGESYDIARLIILINSIILVPVLVVGTFCYVWGWAYARAFNISEFFTAIMEFEAAVGTLMTTGSASIYFKRSTEPDGTQAQVEKTITTQRN